MAHEVIHERWGSNMDRQLSAKKRGPMTWEYREETHRTWFGRKKLHIEKVPIWHNDDIDAGNDEGAHRIFQHRCGLIKLVLVQERYSRPIFLTFFDGHVTSTVDINNIEFRLAPEDLVQNDGKPIVDITFSGWGRRRGPFSVGYESGIEALVCTFANKVQMEQYLDTKNIWVRDEDGERSLRDILTLVSS